MSLGKIDHVYETAKALNDCKRKNRELHLQIARSIDFQLARIYHRGWEITIMQIPEGICSAHHSEYTAAVLTESENLYSAYDIIPAVALRRAITQAVTEEDAK